MYFNGCRIDHVVKYQYLANIVKSTRRFKEDALGDIFKYMCNQAHKALFGMHKKTLKRLEESPRDNASHV